jgi:hypothetical protein
MRRAGIHAVSETDENEDFLIYTVRIPKADAPAAGKRFAAADTKPAKGAAKRRASLPVPLPPSDEPRFILVDVQNVTSAV